MFSFRRLSFKKIVYIASIITFAGVLYSCSGIRGISSAKKKVVIPNTRPVEQTTDWKAVDFTKYDQDKVDCIYNQIIHNQAYRVEITYNKNFELAQKLLRGIQFNINYMISKKVDKNIKNNEVVVTIYKSMKKGMHKETNPNTPDRKTIDVGEIFIVELKGNPTTGYAWELDKGYDNAVVKLVKSDFKQNYTEKPMSGVGGVFTFEVKGLKKGKTTLKFDYYRSWESKEKVKPIETKSYNVYVL